MRDDTRPAARLTVLTGPSGAGKDSVAGLVRARSPWLWISVPATTRPPRAYESDGVDHLFVDRSGFERLIAAGEMLEWAELGGHLYGTPREPVAARLSAGWSVLVNLDPPGAWQVRRAMPQARVVLLARPGGPVCPAGFAHPAGPAHPAASTPAAAGAGYDATVVNDHVERAAEELVGLLGSSVLAPAGPDPTQSDPA